MATRAEESRDREQRHGPSAKARKRAAGHKSRGEKLAEPHPTKRAERKASYALEAPSAKGASSRKSTRASANRVKADSNLNLREERQKGSPEARFRKARVKTVRVRGAPAP